MTRRSGTVLLAGAVSLAALLAGYFELQRRAPPAARASADHRSLGREPPAPPAPTLTPAAEALPAPAAPNSVPAPAEALEALEALDEPALMQRLRRLRSSDPELTLQLSRRGNQRFPSSADAAERAWFVVKALSDLGRHDEARAEGRSLLERYRGSRWAEDVHRHLFVNPPTHPFERGYAKQLESDP